MIKVVRVDQEEATLIETIGGESFEKEVIHHSRCYQGMVKSYEDRPLLLMTLARARPEDGILE